MQEKVDPVRSSIWFHFASLGEFEQGRPLLEKIKSTYPHKQIVITFFSPSGYEIRKNYALANGVFYLPLDTPSNAKQLIAAINPEIAVFTKYEYWYHYFEALHKSGIPLYIISGIFRPNQIFLNGMAHLTAKF
ncbi:3-deoxy-D-manno-octulosonic acid transferase [Pedobacter steynii]